MALVFWRPFSIKCHSYLPLPSPPLPIESSSLNWRIFLCVIGQKEQSSLIYGNQCQYCETHRKCGHTHPGAWLCILHLLKPIEHYTWEEEKKTIQRPCRCLSFRISWWIEVTADLLQNPGAGRKMLVDLGGYGMRLFSGDWADFLFQPQWLTNATLQQTFRKTVLVCYREHYPHVDWLAILKNDQQWSTHSPLILETAEDKAPNYPNFQNVSPQGMQRCLAW